MKTFEYFVSYFYETLDGKTGFGSSILSSDEDFDDVCLSDIASAIMNESSGLGSEFKKAVPFFYHKRREVEE